MRYLLLGAGKMGRAVVHDLCKYSPDAQLIVVDSHPARLEAITEEFPHERISVIKADVSDVDEMSYILSSADIVISCVSHRYNYGLAKAAIEAGTHFCDLGGSEDVTRKQFLLDEMARDKGVAVVPDCGLAPGLVSILAAAAVAELDETHEIRIFVGGLPVDPRPPLNYAQTFSVEGLIDEYVEDATIIRDGKLLRVPSLTELEEIEFPAPFGKMEAFHTAGGISTLPVSFGSRVRKLEYKTIRFPGHCEKMKLLKDLGFMDASALPLTSPPISARTVLAQVLEKKLPKDDPDTVLLRVEAKGTRKKAVTELKWECIDYSDEENNLSAMMRCTAFPISIIAQMLPTKYIKDRGTLYQEQSIPVDHFLKELAKRGIEMKKSEKTLTSKQKQ